MVNVQKKKLIEMLGIKKLLAVIGGSMGECKHYNGQ